MPRQAGLAACGLLLLALACTPKPAGSSGTVFFGVALEGDPAAGDAVLAAAHSTRLSPEMVVFFLQWPKHPGENNFPADSLAAVDAFGALPCLTWEPMYLEDGREVAVDGEAIVSGQWDGYIDAFARAAAAYKRPFILRFGHEMNISRYHWGTGEAEYGPKSPAIFRRMFNHVAERFELAGADNALFAFCPNAESIPNESFDAGAGWNVIEAWWPGGKYVDVLGVDGYNWGDTQTLAADGWESSWRSFADIFAPAVKTLRELAPDKEIVVFETASAPSGGDKAAWIGRAARTASEWGLAGLCWFEASKEVDWRMGAGADRSYVPVMRRLSSGARRLVPEGLRSP